MTLVELAVVIAIIGIVTMMAAPRFYNMISTLRARGAADQLVSDVAYTRLNAVRNGRTASLTISGGNSYSMVVENTDGSTFRTLRTVNVASSYPGTTLAGESGNGRIAFDSRGMLRSNSTSGVTVSRGGRSQRLLVNAVGRVIRDTIR